MAPAKAKRGAAGLIKQFFGSPTPEIMALSKEDRVQLGSAIARQLGMVQEELEFELVAY